MKCINLLAALFLSLIAFSCMIDPEDNKTQQPEPQQPQLLQPAFVNPNTASGNSGGASTAQQHYICPNGCSGSGGATQGTCSVCGTAYVHNAAYHNQANATPTPAQAPTFQPPNVTVNDASTAGGGVYHYTCPNGCAGGSSTQGTCATCGTALAHNQAYHAQNATTTTTTTPQPASAGAPTPNAAGEYHYICSNGCAGGSNSSGACPTCGGALAHNQAYHQ